MTDLAERPGVDLADADERLAHDVFLRLGTYKRRLAEAERMIVERDDVIARQREEMAEIRRELRQLRRGEAIQVVIEGRTFPLIETPDGTMVVSTLIADDVRQELSQKLAAVRPNGIHSADWLNSAQRRPNTDEMTDSLVSFKE